MKRFRFAFLVVALVVGLLTTASFASPLRHHARARTGLTIRWDDNIVCLMDEAIDRRKSEVARLGDAFARDAAQGNAFSKIGRYETGIDRRLSRKLQELAALQEARRAGAQA